MTKGKRKSTARPKLPRVGTVARYRYLCVGGPYGGEFLLMPEHTMVYTVREFCGYYKKGVWHDVR